ncbi:RluA family pseudouridine synthase [bacterium]|nr:RluA family pseudouridine synthase [bacterium]
MNETIELTVDRAAEDVLTFLCEALPTLPLGAIRRMVAHGGATVDGKRVSHNFPVALGQNVTLTLPEKPIVRYEPKPLDFQVLFEDADLLVIHKPVGLVVVPDPGALDATLLNGLIYYVQNASPHPCPRVYVVHRLDRDTSGVLLVAKNPAAARHYSTAFEHREVHKEYLAVVQGEVAADEGDVDRALAQHTGGRMRLRERRGKPALSRYRVVERFRGFTLLQVEPLTGRQHQVRLHCSAIGHPLAVDRLYGGRNALYLSEIKRSYRPHGDRPESPIMDRLTLHAHRLDVPRPDGSRLALEAPIPADLERLLRTLRKYAAKQ